MKKSGRKSISGNDHRTSYLKSVERTLDILDLISTEHSLTLTEIAELKNVRMGTAHRILSTLKKKGFVAQDLSTERYSTGNMVFKMAQAAINLTQSLEYVKPYLDDLCNRVGENVIYSVVVPQKDKMSIVAEVIAKKSIIVNSILYNNFPIFDCASGKTYLMSLSDNELKAFLQNKKNMKSNGATLKSQIELIPEINKFKDLGYAYCENVLIPGIYSICSGVYNNTKKFIGSIGLVIPQFRLTDKKTKEFADILLEVCKNVNQEIGDPGFI